MGNDQDKCDSLSSWVQYSVFCKAGEQVKITDKLKTVGQAVCSTCISPSLKSLH